MTGCQLKSYLRDLKNSSVCTRVSIYIFSDNKYIKYGIGLFTITPGVYEIRSPIDYIVNDQHNHFIIRHIV